VGLKRRTLVKVFVNSGETLNLGSSANSMLSKDGKSKGSIVVTDPFGNIYNSDGALGVGIINKRSEEMAGPKTNTNISGYNPYMINVTVAGIWTVEFRAPVNGNTAGSNNLTASADWSRATHQPNDQAQVLAWDVTVKNNNDSIINGRAYTNAFAGTMRGSSRAFSANFFILTKGGWLYNFDGNGMDPYGFIFISNSTGNMIKGTNKSAYSSASESNANIYDPDLSDGEVSTHKIFFNKPSTDMPENAKSLRGNEWLMPSQSVTPGLSNFTFSGFEGTKNVMGKSIGGNFEFTSTVEGKYNVNIDMNGNNILKEGVDVMLDGNMKVGVNNIYWDGKNKEGNIASSQTLETKNITLDSSYAEVHFPFYDVESNQNGYILTRLNGPGAPDNKIYWDDRAFTDVKNFQNNMDMRGGISSGTGAHKWKINGSGTGGDTRVVDTWGYIKFLPLSLNDNIQIKHSNIYILSNTNTLANIKDDKKVSFTLVANNDGPDAANGTTLMYKIPDIIDNANIFSCEIIPLVIGDENCKIVKSSNNEFIINVNIKSGSSAKLVISGDLNLSKDSNNVEVIGGIMRPADIYDEQSSVVSNIIYTRNLNGLKASCVDAGYSNPPCDNYSLVSYKKQNVISTTTNQNNQLSKDQNTIQISTSTNTNVASQTNNLRNILRIMYTDEINATITQNQNTQNLNQSNNILNSDLNSSVTLNTNASNTKKVTPKTKDFSENKIIVKDALEEFSNKIVTCEPVLKREVNVNSSKEEINNLKIALNKINTKTKTKTGSLFSTTSKPYSNLELNGVYDEVLKKVVIDYQNTPLHKLTILKAGGMTKASGVVGKYTVAQINADSCYLDIPNRCPYFYDYGKLGDKNGSQNKLQKSTTTQMDLWKEFFNQLFPNENLKYDGVFDEDMKRVAGNYQLMYKRPVLSAWKNANPDGEVTYWLRESSRNWANYMVACPEGPIELWDGSGNVDYR
jgi:hypothetical protein